jgi:hypothetical protein
VLGEPGEDPSRVEMVALASAYAWLDRGGASPTEAEEVGARGRLGWCLGDMGVANPTVWAGEGDMGLGVLLPTALISYVKDKLLGEDEKNTQPHI